MHFFLSSKYRYQALLKAIEISLCGDLRFHFHSCSERHSLCYCLIKKPSRLRIDEAFYVAISSWTNSIANFRKGIDVFWVVECFVFLVNMKKQIASMFNMSTSLKYSRVWPFPKSFAIRCCSEDRFFWGRHPVCELTVPIGQRLRPETRHMHILKNPFSTRSRIFPVDFLHSK